MFTAKRPDRMFDDLMGFSTPTQKTVSIDLFGSPKSGENVTLTEVLVANGGAFSGIVFTTTSEKPPRAQALDKIAEILGIVPNDSGLKVKGLSSETHSYTYQLSPDQFAALRQRGNPNITFRAVEPAV